MMSHNVPADVDTEFPYASAMWAEFGASVTFHKAAMNLSTCVKYKSRATDLPLLSQGLRRTTCTVSFLQCESECCSRHGGVPVDAEETTNKRQYAIRKLLDHGIK